MSARPHPHHPIHPISINCWQKYIIEICRFRFLELPLTLVEMTEPWLNPGKYNLHYLQLKQLQSYIIECNVTILILIEFTILAKLKKAYQQRSIFL